MTCTCALYVFAVEMFFKTGEYVIATHRSFQADFMLCQNNVVPNKKINTPIG